MTLLRIVLKDLLLLARDRRALITLLGTPLILTFILGLVFGSMWNSEMPPSLVLYQNLDQGELGRILFDHVFRDNQISGWVHLQQIDDADAAQDQVRQGRATAFIKIPPNFSMAVQAGSASIQVFGDPASTIRVQIIQAITESFAAELSARHIIWTTVAASGAEQLSLDQVEAALAGVHLTAKTEIGYKAQPTPVAMDYYAAGMGVMYLMFTVSHGASGFLRERQTGTLARMLQSSARSWQITAGKFLGVLALGLAQITVIIIFTSLVFGVSWGNPLGVAVQTFAAAFAASGIAMVLASVARTASAASAMGTMIILPMSALGGSMFPIVAMSPLLKTLSRFTLNGWAMEGYVRLMFEGGGIRAVLAPSLVMLVAGAVLLSIAGMRLVKGGYQS